MSGRSEAGSLYGRRSGGYTRLSAPGCRFRPLALSFQQVPRPAAAGYSRSNREQPILRSTAVFLAGSRSGNLQQPCSTRAGVTCHPSCRCFSSVALRDADSCAARVPAIRYPLGSFATCALRQSRTAKPAINFRSRLFPGRLLIATPLRFLLAKEPPSAASNNGFQN